MRIYISDLTTSMIKNINEKVASNGEKFKPHVLFPYSHVGSGRSNGELFKLIENRDLSASLMVDSGTYVMHKLEEDKGISFNYEQGFNDYTNFLKESTDFYNEVDYYINYDVSFNVEDAYQVNSNYQEKMESLGLKPVYVIHSLTNSELQYIHNKKYKFVALSSAMLSQSGDFDKANDIVEILYNQGVRVHLLGCASFNKLSQTYAWSCDASSYGRWSGFAKVIFYSEIEKKEKRLSLSTYNGEGELNKDFYGLLTNQNLRHEYDDFIYNGIGLTLDDIAEDETGSNLIQANAYYMYYLEQMINRIQESKGIVFPEW